MRKMFVGTLTAAMCATSVMAFDPTPATAQTGAMPDLKQAYPSESYTQYYSGRRGYYGRRSYYRGGRGYGGAAAAGIAGLAAGALIGGAIASQQAAPPPPPYAVAPVAGGGEDWLAYCSQRYRSFDPGSGTFLGNDGRRHACQ